MKRLISVLIILLLLLSGCGSDEPAKNNNEQAEQTAEPTAEPADDNNSQNSDVSTSKTYNFIVQQYGGDRSFMIYEDMSMGGRVEMYLENDKMAIYSEDPDGLEQIVIIDEEFMYIITPSENMGFSMPLDSEEETGMEFDSTTPDMEDDPQSFTDIASSGSEEIEGTTYEYEEFSVDGQGVRYYFEGNRLRYIGYIGSGENVNMYMKIVDYGTDFSNDVFEVPEDIVMTSMEDMFNMNMEE